MLRSLARPLVLFAPFASLLAQSPEDKPWRLGDVLGAPAWLRIGGEQRSRYETLDHQFRYRTVPASGAPSREWADTEDVLALRTLLLMEAKGEAVAGAVELIDARQYGTSDNGFLDTTMVDTLDLLQAYGDLQLGSLGAGKHRLRVGRETMDLGSRRLVGRNQMRNTINSFNAIDWQWTGDGESLRAFWSMPTDRLPGNLDVNDVRSAQDAALDDLRDNDQRWDSFSTDTQFAGLYHDRKLDERTTFDVYVFGFLERGDRTRRRELWTPGLHVGRTRKPGTWHTDAELTGQLGHSKVNTRTSSPRLAHRAAFATAALGYTWQTAWSPGLTASYAYATGDRDPNDDDDGRYDTLFGVRRADYGPTGIYGAVARANLSSPELRMHLQPGKTVEVQAAVRDVYLAASRDAWTTSGLRDTTGGAGTHVGLQYELRVRWDVVPRNVQIEGGAAYLAAGSFQKHASAGQANDTSYAYLQCTWFF